MLPAVIETVSVIADKPGGAAPGENCLITTDPAVFMASVPKKVSVNPFAVIINEGKPKLVSGVKAGFIKLTKTVTLCVDLTNSLRKQTVKSCHICL